MSLFYLPFYTDESKGTGKVLFDTSLFFNVLSTSIYVVIFQFFFNSIFLASIWESYRVIEIKFGDQTKFEFMTVK